MRKIRFSAALAAIGASGVAAVAFAAPAAAVATPASPLTAAKAQALRTIDVQRFGLAVANWNINVDRAAAADKAALSTPVRADLTSLASLRAAVVKDVSVAAVTSHVDSVKALHVADFVLPKVSTVLRSDDLTALATRLAAEEARYSTAINAAKTVGKNVTAPTAALADYTAKVSAMKTAAASAHDAALPLVVSGFPGNAASLKAAQASVRTAEADLVAAVRDARVLQQVHTTR
jgi:hypothetical protein